MYPSSNGTEYKKIEIISVEVKLSVSLRRRSFGYALHGFSLTAWNIWFRVRLREFIFINVVFEIEVNQFAHSNYHIVLLAEIQLVSSPSC